MRSRKSMEDVFLKFIDVDNKNRLETLHRNRFYVHASLERSWFSFYIISSKYMIIIMQIAPTFQQILKSHLTVCSVAILLSSHSCKWFARFLLLRYHTPYTNIFNRFKHLFSFWMYVRMLFGILVNFEYLSLIWYFSVTFHTRKGIKYPKESVVLKITDIGHWRPLRENIYRAISTSVILSSTILFRLAISKAKSRCVPFTS